MRACILTQPRRWSTSKATSTLPAVARLLHKSTHGHCTQCICPCPRPAPRVDVDFTTAGRRSPWLGRSAGPRISPQTRPPSPEDTPRIRRKMMLRTFSLLLLASAADALPVVVVARAPVWLRHYNASVAPPRCGDINIEPLFPIGISNETIRRYASNTVEDYSPYVLELGECGKSCCGPDEPLNHSWPVINMTKRNNPPSLPAPWFTHGNKPGEGFLLFQLCVDECVCSATGKTVHSGPGIQCPVAGCPPCTDANCKGRCVLCSPSFNQKLEGTMINLWCDPSDPDCKNGRASRPVPPPPSPAPSTPLL